MLRMRGTGISRAELHDRGIQTLLPVSPFSLDPAHDDQHPGVRPARTRDGTPDALPQQRLRIKHPFARNHQIARSGERIEAGGIEHAVGARNEIGAEKRTQTGAKSSRGSGAGNIRDIHAEIAPHHLGEPPAPFLQPRNHCIIRPLLPRKPERGAIGAEQRIHYIAENQPAGNRRKREGMRSINGGEIGERMADGRKLVTVAVEEAIAENRTGAEPAIVRRGIAETDGEFPW